MNGASWIELTTPVTMAQSKGETLGVPKNASACKSEFHLELSSMLASTSAPVDPCPRQGKVNDGCDAPAGNGAAGFEHEEDTEEVGHKGGSGGLELAAVMLLRTTQLIFGTQNPVDFSWERVTGIEPEQGIRTCGSIVGGVQEPMHEVEFCQTVSGDDYPNSLLQEDISKPEDMASISELREPGRGLGKTDADSWKTDAGLPKTDAGLPKTNVDLDKTDADLPKTDADFGKIGRDLKDKAMVPEKGLSIDESEAPMASRKSRAESLIKLSDERHVQPVEAALEGIVRHEGDGSITHVVRDMESLMHDEGVGRALSFNPERVRHEEEQGSDGQIKLGRENLNKLSELKTVGHADNEDKSLLPQDMPETTKAREYPVKGHANSKEIRRVSEGEMRIPDTPRKARPVRDTGRPRFAQAVRVSHEVYEGVMSKDEIGNPEGTYLQPSLQQPNQRLLRSSMIRQIVDKAELRLGRGQAEMVIDLKPDILGRVHLKVSSEAGRVVAEIRAESAGAKALIESGLADLETALSEKGFSFDALTVSLDSSPGSMGAKSGGNNLSWFSEPNGWDGNHGPTETWTGTNAVGIEDTPSLAAAFGTRTRLDYTA